MKSIKTLMLACALCATSSSFTQKSKENNKITKPIINCVQMLNNPWVTYTAATSAATTIFAGLYIYLTSDVESADTTEKVEIKNA